jgi:hypothetical protein
MPSVGLVELIDSHTLPNAEIRYPGLAGLKDYTWYQMIILAAVPCELKLFLSRNQLTTRCPVAKRVLQGKLHGASKMRPKANDFSSSRSTAKIRLSLGRDKLLSTCAYPTHSSADADH